MSCHHGKLDGCAVCEEIEQLHVQLAGCGVAAMSNTRESLARAKEVQPGAYGFSASYSDVLRCVEREIQEREAKERAEAALLCPGQMRCAKCKFELTRRTLFVLSGTVGAGTSETEPCPNGCGPLWPVTWEQEARSCYASLDRLFDEKQKAESALAALRAENESLRDEAKARYAVSQKDVWYWQGDGSDHPESLANACHVVMTGAQLRAVLASADGRVSVPREPTEAMLIAGIHALHNPKCHESGRYSAAAVYAFMLAAADKEPRNGS